MTRSAPARKPDPVSALLALRMQARGFPRGWSVSPYRGRARLRVTAGAGDGKQRQVLMTWPWSPAHAEDIAADAVAAREAFLGGTPLDDALQLALLQELPHLAVCRRHSVESQEIGRAHV